MADYNGLTRNAWTGTWSPSGDHPIVLDTEIRGGLRYISGDAGDQLTDITGQRLQEGMIVYVKNTYGSVTGNKFYSYSLLGGEQRNASTGDMPNAAGNWTEFVSGAIPATVGDLTDVSNTAPTVGQVLKWDGSQWVPSADNDATPSVGDLTDVSNATPSVGQVLKWDGSQWVPSVDNDTTTVGDLTDVSSATPSVGQVLKWDGSQWVPSADATGSGGGGGGIEEGDAIAFAIALGS
jgi:hypothetical protein